MPLIKLPDGTNLFVKSNDPKDIEQAKNRFYKKKKHWIIWFFGRRHR